MRFNPPKISILMPSFNQGRYLDAAIRSVLSQNYPNKELIVIDGGSTDHSVEIIKRHERDLAWWVSESDRGQSHALNKALDVAKGEIIGWLNSDDCYLPGAFRRVARAFDQNSEAIVIHGDRIMIDSDGHVMGWTALPAFDPATTGYIVCSETAFWRKSGVGDLRFDESLRFAIDLDFFGRLSRTGSFVKLDHYLGAFRCHEASKSSTLPDVCRSESEAQWKKIFSDNPDGWKNEPRAGNLKILLRLFRHPFIIALPYFYRRYHLGLKGLQTAS